MKPSKSEGAQINSFIKKLANCILFHILNSLSPSPSSSFSSSSCHHREGNILQSFPSTMNYQISNSSKSNCPSSKLFINSPFIIPCTSAVSVVDLRKINRRGPRTVGFSHHDVVTFHFSQDQRTRPSEQNNYHILDLSH